MFHRTKFCELRVSEVDPDRCYWLRVSSRKGRGASARLVTGDIWEAQYEYKKVARYLNDHPTMKHSDFCFYAADRHWASIHEERTIRYNLYWKRVMDVKAELGLDWEDVELNDFADLRAEADAEYDRAADMAADYYKAYGIEKVDDVWYVFKAAKGLGTYWTEAEANAAAEEMNQDWGIL